MNKLIIATVAALVASPVAAQTTTCRNIVANAPQFGVTCETQQQPSFQAPGSNGMPTAQLQFNTPDAPAAAPPPAPSAGRSVRKALFGF